MSQLDTFERAAQIEFTARKNSGVSGSATSFLPATEYATPTCWFDSTKPYMTTRSFRRDFTCHRRNKK
jgi:hypothetical protein